MDLHDAVQKAGQILDQERVSPTVKYEVATTDTTMQAIYALSNQPSKDHGRRFRGVEENPDKYQLKSVNFDLLSALLGQLPEQDQQEWLASLRSRISSLHAYRHLSSEVLGAGTWRRCSSELPLIAEFLVRRGDKLFIATLRQAAPSPGLTLLLIQIEEMIALNFTLFTDDEYAQLSAAITDIRRTVVALEKQPKPNSTRESNVIYHVRQEVPEFCDSLSEGCRKARYLYVKGSLLPGMNLEVNQDKTTVRTFLEKLGFAQLLIQSLDEAERLYRTAATPFDLKNSMGHLRSFLEQLHVQACALAHRKFGGSQPSKWGEANQYLRDHDVLTTKEQQFAIHFYTLMSDTSVHPLVAEREYSRLMRNMSIEYGLLLLTKLDKLGLK